MSSDYFDSTGKERQSGGPIKLEVRVRKESLYEPVVKSFFSGFIFSPVSEKRVEIVGIELEFGEGVE